MRRSPHPYRPILVLVLVLPLQAGCDAAPSRDRQADVRGPGATAVAVPRGDSLSGRELAAVLGCGACHPGAPPPGEARAVAPDLSRLDGWDPAALMRYLRDPPPRRTSLARMPDFRLSEAEAAAVAAHLLRGSGSHSIRSELRSLARTHPGATPARGAAIVAALNCAGCHAGAGEMWLPGPPLAGVGSRLRPDWLASFLAMPSAVRPFGYYPGSGSRMPDFSLAPAEVDSLLDWLVPAGAPAAAAGPAEPTEPAARLSRFRARKAEALLRDQLSCLGCHGLGGAGGRVAPALDGAALRLRPAYLRRVIRRPSLAGPGTIMPAPLEDSATLELVTAYLLERESPGDGGAYLSLVDHAPRPPDASGQRGPAALYAAYCAVCHGAEGRGDGFNAPHLPRPPTPHADPAVMASRADAALFDGIHGGGRVMGGSRRMPAFGATLSPAEIGGLVSHLRRLCPCDQPEWATP